MNKKNLKVTKRVHAFKDFASSYNIESLNYFNPDLLLKDTESVIKSKLIELLTILKDFEFVATLFLELKKIESEDKTKYDTFYSNSKVEKIMNKSSTGDVFEPIYTAGTSNIKKSLGKNSGWIIDLVMDHTISISIYI